MDKHTRLTLQFFADGGGAGGAGGADGGASGAADGGTASLESIQYGLPDGDDRGELAAEQPSRKQQFEAMVKGEWKQEFADYNQQIFNSRFKDYKTLQGKMEQANPVMEMLAQRYGIQDPTDFAAVKAALEDDDSYYADEAEERGLSVAQLKQFKQIERENAEFRKTAQEAQRQQNADRIYQQWIDQADQVKQLYGDFDLRGEITNGETGERFMALLRNGIDVKTAYEVIHKDDLLSGAIRYAATRAEKRVTDNIRARGMRPAENGGGGSAAAVIRKSDVNSLTKADRDEIARRVRRGERITF